MFRKALIECDKCKQFVGYTKYSWDIVTEFHDCYELPFNK